MSEEKKYINFDLAKGYPAGDKIQYECVNCGDILLSIPMNSMACKCRNIIVDVDAGRVTVKDGNKFRTYIVE
jgi:hypothetical protein